MNKEIWKLPGEWSSFVGNILMGVKKTFLPIFAPIYT